ncbi:sensitivity to high expression protein she9 [Tulasnella sp. 418]|nr:sensitivity to high expression protein she9 [Tulasnella sp. 418]
MNRHIFRISQRSFATSSRLRSTQEPSKTIVDSDKWKQELNGVRDRLKLWAQLNSTLLRQRASSLTSTASVHLSEVGGKLNQVTGYDEVEALKRKVVETEQRMTELKNAAKEAKIAYEQAVSSRSSGQREVNDLLQRKSSWNDSDVTRFTSLVRQDHLNEQTENNAKVALAQAEEDVEREFTELMRAILNRYHEEQVWSDKIRSASTYGSLLVLGVNVAVFILAIVFVEPYKRKRLAQTFEKRIEEISKENQVLIESSMKNLSEHFEKQEAVLTLIAANASPSTSSPTQNQIIPSQPVVEEEPVKPVEVVEVKEVVDFLPKKFSWIPIDVAKAVGSAVAGGIITAVMYQWTK